MILVWRWALLGWLALSSPAAAGPAPRSDAQSALASRQLDFLRQTLQDGAAERMQRLFPEGYVFTWALYGLAAAQLSEAFAHSDPHRRDLLQRAQTAVAALDSSVARRPFDAGLQPAFGALYAGWSLYLRGVLLRAWRVEPEQPPPFDLERYQKDCLDLAAAFEHSDTPFLASYRGQVWPADSVVALAALAIHDRLFEPRFQPVIARWVAAARLRLDDRYGALPHAANARTGRAAGSPRGSSLALMSLLLVEIDRPFAAGQYALLRQHFFDSQMGIRAMREYPLGENGQADIDSGPLLLGFSGPATVVGAGAARANGDHELSATLLATVETFGAATETDGQRRYAGGELPVGDAFLAWARTVPEPSTRSTASTIESRKWLATDWRRVAAMLFGSPVPLAHCWLLLLF